MRRRSRAGLLTGLALALLLLTPLLGPGYVLVRDMVFVPRTPLGGQLLGAGVVPRGVPSEAVVALAGRVVPVGWFQDLVLIALVVGGAWGAARLAPTTSLVGSVSAATAYGWSPYLHERLLLGQWALLVGWAVLPWAVRAALDWRRGATGWWAVSALAVAALGGANALLLVGLAVTVCGRPVRALAATAVLSLPWAVPGLLAASRAGDPYGVDAFAANSDGPLGVVGSLLTGGGVWAREAAPPGRAAGTWLAVLMLTVAAVGLPRLRARLGDRLPVAAALGLVLALLGTFPPTRVALRWAVVHLPATGLLRDGQKWVVPLVLLVSALVACGAEALLARIPVAATRRVATVLLTLLPVAALPGAAWGESGRLTTSQYPAEWRRVTGLVHGDVLVLPWAPYRSFAWDAGRTVLDPATKLLAHPVTDDALPLPGRRVTGEDPRAARLDAVVRSGLPLADVLRREHVTEVLVERRTTGADAARAGRQTQGLVVVTTSPELDLYAVPGAVQNRRGEPMTALLLLLLDLAVLALAGVAVVMGVRARRSYLPEG